MLIGVAALLATPAAAAAHGPVAPVATSYLARVHEVPAGLTAVIVDGYVRIWLHVPASRSVIVLDYRAAPYLRFSSHGVEVNQNSVMWYLNQTPVAGTPPAGLSRTTAPHWYRVSGGHDYEWHDGRLQALASIAASPGTTYLGPWSIPLLIDGHRSAVSGGLWRANAPSPFWFWPIVVLLACVLAAWRVRRPGLDARVAATLGTVAVTATVLAAAGRGLHGRPGLDTLALTELVGVAAFAAWALRSVLTGRANYFTYLVIAIAGMWEGLDLLPTLLHHYVLIALPAVVARSATVLCLGASLGILVLVFRLAESERGARPTNGAATAIRRRGRVGGGP